MNAWGPLGGLSRLRDERSRSISAENRDGAKGGAARATQGAGSHAARLLGPPWKISPCDKVAPGATLVVADIEGPGVVRHVWMTLTGAWRDWILRVWWDGQELPSIEVPAGDFFCMGWGRYAQVDALPVNVNPGSGFNCYWEMPFRRRCRIALENRSDSEQTAFYQVDYGLTAVPEECAYLHASFRRPGPVPAGEVLTILDGVRGRGHYVGTYLAWEVRGPGWWGEGELRFFLDGDGEHPTISGTGTEDYFGGSYNFEADGDYRPYSAPFLGLPQVIRPRATTGFPQRFGLYRFHVPDPIRFERDLRVTCQVLGWHAGEDRFEQRADDVAATSWWYQTLPTAPLPPLPDRATLAVG
jgi:hypothetical protein